MEETEKTETTGLCRSGRRGQGGEGGSGSVVRLPLLLPVLLLGEGELFLGEGEVLIVGIKESGHGKTYGAKGSE